MAWTVVWQRTKLQKLKERLICSHKGHVPMPPENMHEGPCDEEKRLIADMVTYCERCGKALHFDRVDKGPYVYEPLILPAVR